MRKSIDDATSCEEVLWWIAGYERRSPVRELTLCRGIDHMAKLHTQDALRGSSEQLEANRTAFGGLAKIAFARLEELTSDGCTRLFEASAQMQAPFTDAQQAAWEQHIVEEVLPEATPEEASRIRRRIRVAAGILQQSSNRQLGSAMLEALGVPLTASNIVPAPSKLSRAPPAAARRQQPAEGSH